VSVLLDNNNSDQIACESVINAIYNALKLKGLFLLAGHGFTDEFIDASMNASKYIFNLTEEEKMKVKMNNKAMRGYIPFGGESGLRDAVFEPKEGYAYGNDNDNDNNEELNYLNSPNIWPKQQEFNAHAIVLQELLKRKNEIAFILCKVLLRYNGMMDEDNVHSILDGGNEISVMRLFHYLHVNQGQGQGDKDILGSSAHTDWGMMTLILQDGVGGLEYLAREDGQWHNVPCRPGTLVVNGGDFLSLLHPDYHSPIHRVLSPTTQDRFSFVFFFYPNFSTPMKQKSIEKSATITKEEENHEGNKRSFEFNTLLKSNSNAKSFGEFIIEKWAGVATY
jgi:isopenicillin N synthase-like dioxygenase